MMAQPWDFGPVGNLAWRHFPEARDDIKDLVSTELQRAIDDDRAPEPVDQHEYALHAVGPLVRDLGLGLVELDRDLSDALARHRPRRTSLSPAIEGVR